MNSMNRSGRSAAVVLVMALALAACSSGKGSTAKPDTGKTTTSKPVSTAQLVAGSKSEKGLVIYANAASQLLNQFTAAFHRVYPSINVKTYDLEDPVVFSRYAAEHGTGSRSGDILIASAPGLWRAAINKGYLENYTPPGVKDFPSLASQGDGLYIMSPDPVVTIYNKKLLKGASPPKTVAAIAEGAAAGKYTVATYSIDNNFGFAAFYGFVHKYGWKTLDLLGRSAKTPGDGDVLYSDVLQGGFTMAVFESGLVRGAIKPNDPLLGWEYTTDFTPLIPRGIGITSGAASPNSAKLFMNYLFSDAGQQAACDAGFMAYSNTFKSNNGCRNTLKDLYAAMGSTHNAVMVPISQKVADDQPSFTARWKKAFKNR